MRLTPTEFRDVVNHAPPSSEHLQIFLEIATEAASCWCGSRLLGQVRRYHRKGRPGDLVTKPIKPQAVILDVLHRHLPSHSILAEESGKLGNTESEYLWAIDPLDGTLTPYTPFSLPPSG